MILLPEPRIETVTAARLVRALCADEHTLAARHQTLRVIGGRAADHADRQRLGDVLGDREQLRDRLERLAEIILIEPRDDHPLALIGERAADRRQLVVEELAFVDADDFGVGATRSSSSREDPTFCDSIRIALCEVMWSSAKRSSMRGLKIWTLRFAICARLRRRISSSLLPLNMLPAMTSIHPPPAMLNVHS